MATYESSVELEGNILNYDDNIIFRVKNKTFCYEACRGFLNTMTTGRNDLIFKELKIEKCKFAEEFYGYPPDIGIFPTCHENDFEALTRITIALFKECEKVNKGVISKKETPNPTCKERVELKVNTKKNNKLSVYKNKKLFNLLK